MNTIKPHKTEKKYQIMVATTQHGIGTFAARKFTKDEIIFFLQGRLQSYADKFSIQVGTDLHLRPDVGAYMNHSCEPSVYINFEDLTFRAIRSVSNGDELTFDYNATELELAHPFDCSCGSIYCRGTIRGFKFLSYNEQAKLLGHVPAHLASVINYKQVK